MSERGTAKREIGLFLALLTASSSVFYGLLLLVDGFAERWLAYAAIFMWCPGVAALLTRLVLHRDVRALGWRLRAGWKRYVVAYGLPIAFCLPVYALVWWSGLGDFDPARFEAFQARFGLSSGFVGGSAAVLLILATAPFGMLTALGEELGWRGFLVPRLALFFDLRQTSLLVGLIWALWHVPLIVLVVPLHLPELPAWYATACFTVIVVGISPVFTWLRMGADSVFPAALLHATTNAFISTFDALTLPNGLTPYFTSEYGLGLAIAVALVAWPFWRRLASRDQANTA